MHLELAWISPGILRGVWPDHMSDAELEQGLLAHDLMIVAWNARYSVVYESTAPPNVSPAHRRRLSDWAGAANTGAHRLCAGVAFVAPSPIVRGVVTAIFWFQRVHYPVKIFAYREAAIAWAEERLTQTSSEAGTAAPRPPPGR